MTHQNEPNALIIDTTRCSGCGRCVAACPAKLLTLETINHHKSATLTDQNRCTRCGACLTACPIGAICFATKT